MGGNPARETEGELHFCDRACATDAVGKARVFLSSERPIGAFSRGQESLQFVIGGDSSWSDANGRVWETGTTLFNRYGS
jgi:hypothetical protein